MAYTTYDEGIRMDNVDKKIKLPLCASSGIPQNWIVNLPEDRIEVYAEPESDEYEDQAS